MLKERGEMIVTKKDRDRLRKVERDCRKKEERGIQSVRQGEKERERGER